MWFQGIGGRGTNCHNDPKFMGTPTVAIRRQRGAFRNFEDDPPYPRVDLTTPVPPVRRNPPRSATRGPRSDRGVRRRVFTQAETQALVDAYVNDRATVQELAKRFKAGTPTITRALDDAGVVLRPRGPRGRGDILPESKTCKVCGSRFAREDRRAYEWRTKSTCSRVCAGIQAARGRK